MLFPPPPFLFLSFFFFFVRCFCFFRPFFVSFSVFCFLTKLRLSGLFVFVAAALSSIVLSVVLRVVFYFLVCSFLRVFFSLPFSASACKEGLREAPSRGRSGGRLPLHGQLAGAPRQRHEVKELTRQETITNKEQTETSYDRYRLGEGLRALIWL